MPVFEYRPVPKPSHKRNKPTAKQRGDISASVRLKLHERSGGVCEKCNGATAVEAAHTLRRWKIKGKTTLEDLAHLCKPCHMYGDNTIDGRRFLEQFRREKYEEAGKIQQYYE